MYIDIAAEYISWEDNLIQQRNFSKICGPHKFGTDYMSGNPNEIYPAHYRFLETFDEYFKHPDGILAIGITHRIA